MIGHSLTPGLQGALSLLLDAHEAGAETGRDPWQFALEAHALKDAGLSHSDLRLLVYDGYVKHQVEWTRRGAKQRTFRQPRSLRIEERSCFVLTSAGLELAHEVDGYHTPEASACAQPYWDHDLRELRIGSVVAKRFRQPAKNQETILSAFQREGWPPRIDNPLPGDDATAALERLHDAVKRLNRQHRPALSFHSDGNDGVVWQSLIISAGATSATTLPPPHRVGNSSVPSVPVPG